jgi:tetratricopeptide (TPR) repeat protein
LLLGADKSYVVLKLAEAYLQQGKYLNVIHDLPLEGFAGPARVDLLAYHGDALTGLGRLKDAQRVLEEAVKLDPEAVLPELALILVYIRQGKLQQAQQTSERLLDLEPGDTRVWSAYASVLHAQDRLQETLTFYARAIALDPENVDARVARVGLRLDLGQELEAMEDLEYLKQKFPREPRAAYLRGLVLDRAGDRAASQQALRKCTELMASQPKEIIARNTQLSMSVSLAHYGLGEFERARSYLEQYLSHYPGDVGASRLLGLALYFADDFDAAATVFDGMLAVDRNFLPAHINLVRVKIAQGRTVAARQRLVRLRETWPENATLMLEQARLERLEGALVEARRWGENAQRAQPDELEYQIFLTELYLQMGELAAAEKLAKDSAAVLKEDMGALAILGQVLVRLDKPKEALSIR